MSQPAAQGPWTAVLADNYGHIYDSIDDVEPDDDPKVCVVRGSAAPKDSRLPGIYQSADVLYKHDDFDDDQDLADRGPKRSPSPAP